MFATNAAKEQERSPLIQARALEKTVIGRLRSCIAQLRSMTFVGPMPQRRGEDVVDPIPNPEEYVDPRRFAEDHLMASILEKATTFESTVETEYAARVKFFDAETHNGLTNRRLSDPCQPDWVKHVSKELVLILGDLDSSVLEEIVEEARFGPGACVGVTTRGLVPSHKFDTQPVMTAELVPFFSALAGPFVTAMWPPEKILVARGNHHFTVLKNRQADRNAAKEPLWNSKLQNGIGKRIATRLRRFGVDIRDQGRNRLLAGLAMARRLATLDLSQASDLIAANCVWLLLTINENPQGLRWWHLLNVARSKAVRIKGLEGKTIWHTLQMFCSMGNGFTFPLESAIFLAVCRTVVGVDQRDVLAVYGDDMIMPQEHAAKIIERLEYLGFKVNISKSCLAGKFFESCGSDWFDGQPVRPFFLRWNSESPIPYALQIANALRLWCYRVYGYCPREFLPLHTALKRAVPKAWANPVPVSFGDVGLISTFHEYQATRERPSQPWVEGWIVLHALVTPVDVDRRSFGVLATALETAGHTSMASTAEDVADHPWFASRLSAIVRSIPETVEGTRGCEAVRNQYGQVRTSKTLIPSWDEVDLAWL